MLRIISISFIIVVVMVFLRVPVEAAYVLPYPSFMPGNKIYKVSRIVDQVKKFWHWGSIASVKYHLSLSDKYLVEAKTLFEYKQYLLATDALKRSDAEFLAIPQFIVRAKDEGKDISLLEKTVREAAQEHIIILEGLKEILPAEFIWTPEKKDSTALHIASLLGQSIELRR